MVVQPDIEISGGVNQFIPISRIELTAYTVSNPRAGSFKRSPLAHCCKAKYDEVISAVLATLPASTSFKSSYDIQLFSRLFGPTIASIYSVVSKKA